MKCTGIMTKTPTTPSTMLISWERQKGALERYIYSHGSKLKDVPSTGPLKRPSDLYGAYDSSPVWHTVIEAAMRNEQEEQRFRSFVERYIIEVASKFNDPLKDGFNAICDGKAIYKMIYNAAHDYRPERETGAMGAVGASPNSPSAAITHNDLQAAYEMGVKQGQVHPLPDAPSGVCVSPSIMMQQSVAQRLYNAAKGKCFP